MPTVIFNDSFGENFTAEEPAKVPIPLDKIAIGTINNNNGEKPEKSKRKFAPTPKKNNGKNNPSPILMKVSLISPIKTLLFWIERPKRKAIIAPEMPSVSAKYTSKARRPKMIPSVK